MKLLIHGIRVSNPMKSIGKLKKFIKDAIIFDYGRISIFGALFRTNSIAKDLSKTIKNKKHVTIYAHSHGNAVAIIAAKKYGADIENLICIGAALNRDIVFPANIKNILVLSTKKDKVTKAARFFDSLPFIGWFVPDIWGSMGTDGYIGDDSRVTNVYMKNTIDDHGDYWTDDDIEAVYVITEDWGFVKNEFDGSNTDSEGMGV